MESAQLLIERLNSQDECSKIEAKRGSKIDKSILETVCAFSNEIGLNGGYIVLGVVPEKNTLFPSYEVVGIADPDGIQMDLATQCATMFNVPIRPDMRTEQIDGKAVLVIYVKEMPSQQKPIYFKSERLPAGAMRRIGSTDQRCTEDDLPVFFATTASLDSSIVVDSTVDDLSDEAIVRYRDLRSRVNSFAEELNYNDRDLLLSMSCLRNDGGIDRLTYCGLMVFGSQKAQRRLLPAMRVDYIRVPGNTWVEDPETRFTTIDMRGPLLLTLQRAYNSIADDLPNGFLLPEGQIQASSIGVPNRVLREALVNSFIHRSYRVNEPIQIIRYSNRIEIRNPGYSLKPEDHLGDPGSQQRNPNIAAIFHDTNLAETKGSGIATMRKLMEKASMAPPTFESDHGKNLFTARLLLHHFLSESDLRWLSNFDRFNINSDQRKALIYVKEVGAVDNWSYRQLTGHDVLKSSQELRGLKELDVLIAKGKGKSTYYVPGENLVPYLNQFVKDEYPEFASRDGGLIEPPTAVIEPPTAVIEPPTAVIEPPTAAIEPPTDIEYEKIDYDPFNENMNHLQSILALLPDEVQNRIRSLPRRLEDNDILEDLIVKICKARSFTAKELAILLGRAEKDLLNRYIKPLRIKGKLRYTIPESANHPDQAYISAT